ncbi:hypothetical protein Mx8p29 [Myxococcus phage Mx8]|uniref:p29 n=1 Tax=Myxococcus phage Mx8 TaxID=49964 RepID=Q94MU0_9CAUD|nr:hypothetical protein Mx8p29 [Myxococcus phage Mx8]AAK94364.1 p29 [Myxococcus phage Mx8]
MTCMHLCQRPGCDKPARKRKQGPGYSPYCSETCGQAAAVKRRAALSKSRQTAPKAGEDEGPDLPLNGVTSQMARERRERIALEMLREGWPSTAIVERFAEFPPDVDRIRKKYNLKAERGHQLPGGLPVL